MTRKLETMEVEVGTTVEVNGIERDAVVTFAMHPAEAKTRDYPGNDAEAEFIGAKFDDDGTEVPEKLLDMDYLKDRAFEKSDEIEEDAKARDEAAREDAWEARRERMRERRLDN